MPKSRSRARGQAHRAYSPPKQRRWNKWMAIIPMLALLLATFLGIFGSQVAAGAGH